MWLRSAPSRFIANKWVLASLHPYPLSKATQTGPKHRPIRKAFPLHVLDLAAERVVPLTGFEPVTPSLRRLGSGRKKALYINTFRAPAAGPRATTQAGPKLSGGVIAAFIEPKCFNSIGLLKMTRAGPTDDGSMPDYGPDPNGPLWARSARQAAVYKGTRCCLRTRSNYRF